MIIKFEDCGFNEENINDNLPKWRKPRNFVKYNEENEIPELHNYVEFEHTKIVLNY